MKHLAIRAFHQDVVSRRGKAAFTVLETIIVVAMLLVLAILAFSSLARISDKSKATACVNNLRQIHLAFMGFAADNANTLPLALTGAGVINSAWMNDLTGGGYLPQYKAPSMPSQSIKHPLRDPGSSVATVEVTIGNYGANRDLLGQSSKFTPNPPRLNFLNVSEPSKRLLIMCAGVYSLTYNQASNGSGNTYLPGLPQNTSAVWADLYRADATQGRHGRRVNALFLGGNVESVPPEDLVSRPEAWQRK